MRRAITHRLLLATACLIASCGDRSPNMNDQARKEVYEAGALAGFADHPRARLPVEGAVYQNTPAPDDRAATGLVRGELIETIPIPVDLALLRRGQERFAIACAMCHGEDGSGEGIVVQRGFTRPPSLHSERVRRAPDGHLYRVMTLGFGRMGSYREQLDQHDRWAVVAYIRALQRSQHAPSEGLPAALRERLGAREGGGDD